MGDKIQKRSFIKLEKMNDYKLESALDNFYNSYGKNKNVMMLDAQEQYSSSKWSPRLKEDVIVGAYVKQTKCATEHARNTLECEANVRYSDEGNSTSMDIYYPKSYTKGTQIFMFIHGGYWQEGGLD